MLRKIFSILSIVLFVAVAGPYLGAVVVEVTGVAGDAVAWVTTNRPRVNWNIRPTVAPTPHPTPQVQRQVEPERLASPPTAETHAPSCCETLSFDQKVECRKQRFLDSQSRN